MLDSHGDGAVPLKGQTAGEHLIEHHAGGVNVAAGIGAVPSRLLRRDIVDGAQGLLGQSLGGVLQTGDAEVSHLHTAVPKDHDVLRLDVPMDNTPAVGVAQATHDLGNEVQRFPPVQLSPLLHVLLQCDTIDEFHDDILGIAAPGHIIDRHDVRVGQLRDRLGFRVEAAAKILILRQIIFQDFDGHQAVQPMALGLIDHRHAACADAFQDLIAVIQHFSDIRICHASPPSLCFCINTIVTLSGAPLRLAISSSRSRQVSGPAPWRTSNSIS